MAVPRAPKLTLMVTSTVIALAAAACSSGQPAYLTDIYGWPGYVPERLTVDDAYCFGATFGQTASINLVAADSAPRVKPYSVLFADWVPDEPLDFVIPFLLEDVAEVSVTEIRDLDGFIVEFQSQANETWTGLAWQEGPVLVVVAGPVLTPDEVERVAASIKPATKAEFESCD